jgi:predicted transcriptional regulator
MIQKEKILKYILNKKEAFTIPEIQRELGVSVQTVTRWLFYFCAIGRIKFYKKGRMYIFEK